MGNSSLFIKISYTFPFHVFFPHSPCSGRRLRANAGRRYVAACSLLAPRLRLVFPPCLTLCIRASLCAPISLFVALAPHLSVSDPFFRRYSSPRFFSSFVIACDFSCLVVSLLLYLLTLPLSRSHSLTYTHSLSTVLPGCSQSVGHCRRHCWAS